VLGCCGSALTHRMVDAPLIWSVLVNA
jgi:hypothetical protein